MDDVEVRSELRRLEQVFRETCGELEDRLSITMKDHLAGMKVDMAELRRRQADRDEFCAAERAMNGSRDREIKDLKEKLANADSCARCKNDSRLMRIETYLNILLWVASALATTTLGLIIKTVFDIVSKAKS